MIIHRIRSNEEFIEHQRKSEQALQDHMLFLAKVTPSVRRKFEVPGYSYTAKQSVKFLVDFKHAKPNGGRVVWRERVRCPKTGYNNRLRATFHLFDIEMDAYSDSKIYITEQVTPVFSYFADRFQHVTGSEYLVDGVLPEGLNNTGVRNEDLCSLSFPDKSFDILISLDVFEHIPDYPAAFSECARVLKRGGKMMWSVPFLPSSANNKIRAQFVNGQIEHILPPQYHGDPLSDKGVLCYQYFGWEMLNQMIEAGFKDAYALCFHSIEFGYLGGNQFIFIARK